MPIDYTKLVNLEDAKVGMNTEHEMIASNYSSASTYAVGAYAYHAGTLYKCTTAITTAEAWNSAHWTEAKLGNDLVSQSKKIDNETSEASVLNNTVNLNGTNGGYSRIPENTTFANCKKENNIIDIHKTFSGDGWRINLVGSSLYAIFNSFPAKSSYPNAYVDSIPEFIVGNLYKVNLKVIEGSYTLSNPAAQFCYIDLLNENKKAITSTLPDNSVWRCTELPKAIWLAFRNGTYDCKISVTITDITEQYALDVDETKNILQIFDKITTIGDSLMAGYTSATSPATSSTDAKLRGANWVSYIGSDIDREITNLAIGDSTWKDWRNSTGGTDISGADIDTNCYLVGLGVNDLAQSLTIGTSADIAVDKSENADSVYGNMDYVVRTLHEYNENAHIFLFTIPGPVTNRANVNTAIKYVCNLYSYCHCIDLEGLYTNSFRYGIINATLNGTHYNPLGYRVIANYIENAMNTYIASNYATFAKVPYAL